MDFEDFCRYFTDVVVCQLVERTLLWPSSNWREVRCYGEWAPAPTDTGAATSSTLHGNTALILGKNVKHGGAKQRGTRKETRLGESQQEGWKGGRCDVEKSRKNMKRENDGGEVNGVWDAETDRRSRCGGCMNHRDTFLHNPQVNLKQKSRNVCK